MATCRNGRVSNAVEFVHSSSSKRNYSRDDKSMDMYDVYDYDDPEDFYYESHVPIAFCFFPCWLSILPVTWIHI